MKVELVTFDCAKTLVDVSWTLDGFAKDCMVRLGIELPNAAYARLIELYVASLPEYLEINMTRDPDKGDQYWKRLTERWFEEFGVDKSLLPPFKQVSDELMYGPEQTYFRLYSDVIDCLDTLRSRGIRLAVVSNWDYTLHPILRSLGIYDRFEVVLASMEEGVEKPDPRLFEICLERLGVGAGSAVHVGDDPLDDIAGAYRANIRSIHLRRDPLQDDPEGQSISSLSQLPEVLRSIG